MADTSGQESEVHEVTDVAVAVLDVYRDLRDRRLKAREGVFIAEGLEVVRRFLRSGLPVQSLLVTRGKYERLQADIPAGVPVYVATLEQIESVAGFNVHRGALACGRRPANPDLGVVVSGAVAGQPIIALENVTDAQNVGVIIRNAAAFGVPLVMLGSCCDPFYRRAIRVSMGNVFRIPVYASPDLSPDLQTLRDRYGYRLVAAVASEDATPIQAAPRLARVVLVFGAEGEGLTSAVRGLCDQQVVIPMAPGMDSLNVAVASGIFLHYYAR
jgi:tRNA G18 (ribose-2'-O)-methylase SpoU